MNPRSAFTADMDDGQLATAALKNLLSAAQVTMDLWNEYGLDHAQSEEVHSAMTVAIVDARLALSH